MILQLHSKEIFTSHSKELLHFPLRLSMNIISQLYLFGEVENEHLGEQVKVFYRKRGFDELPILGFLLFL